MQKYTSGTSVCIKKTRVKYPQQLTRTALTIFPLHRVNFILFIECKSSTFTSCSSFSSPGVRTEQDLYIRLIDSMTKQVSCCCTFSFPLFLNNTVHRAPCAQTTWKLSPTTNSNKKNDNDGGEKSVVSKSNYRCNESRQPPLRLFMRGRIIFQDSKVNFSLSDLGLVAGSVCSTLNFKHFFWSNMS